MVRLVSNPIKVCVANCVVINCFMKSKECFLFSANYSYLAAACHIELSKAKVGKAGILVALFHRKIDDIFQCESF